MALKKPNSMDECIYFTSRAIGDKGYAIDWVFKNDCPKCKKAQIGKPKNDKTGKVQIRAKIYICPNCKYSAEKQAYEETLTCNIEYTCPSCGKDGEIQLPFIRKKVEGVDTIKFDCQHCKGRILVTKKMKDIKKKGEEDINDDE